MECMHWGYKLLRGIHFFHKDLDLWLKLGIKITLMWWTIRETAITTISLKHSDWWTSKNWEPHTDSELPFRHKEIIKRFESVFDFSFFSRPHVLYLILKEYINTEISQLFLEVADSKSISSLSCDMGKENNSKNFWCFP